MELHRKFIFFSIFPSYEDSRPQSLKGIFMLKIFLVAYGSNIVQFRNNKGYTEQTYLQTNVS